LTLFFLLKHSLPLKVKNLSFLFLTLLSLYSCGQSDNSKNTPSAASIQTKMAVADTSLLNKAESALNAKNYDEALAILTSLHQQYPKDVEVIYKTGLVYAYQNNLPKAIKCFDQTILLNPKHAKSYGNRGFALYLLESRTEAEADLRKAVELEPQNAKFHHNLGAFLTDENSPEACIELKKARELGYNDPNKFLEQKCK